MKAIDILQEYWRSRRTVNSQKSLGDFEFDSLVKQAREAYDALSPEEKRTHDRKQKISWVYGQIKLSGSNLTMEEVADVVDEHDTKDVVES